MTGELVLLTGASGFLGNYLCEELNHRNTPFVSIGRTDKDSPQHIRCDLTDEVPSIIKAPTKVIHCAGLAHVVPRNDHESAKFTATNVTGTRNLLTGLVNSQAIPEQFVFVSSVAVYGLESGKLIDESHTPNPNTPYGRSKYECEMLLQQWCEKHQVRLLIVRPPLILGQNAKGNLESLSKAIRKGYYVSILGNESCKSVVHAADLSRFLVDAVDIEGTFNITDGQEIRFTEVEELYAEIVQKKIKFKIPLNILKAGALAGDLMLKIGIKIPLSSDKLNKMVTTLTFSDSKLRQASDWNPTSAILRAKQEEIS